MMTGKQLKNAILQLAIQGKLVPQDATDEPASALLARIRKEKEQLVKAGKLKKKDLETTPITDEEKPFEIPESWEWCRIEEISTVVRGGSPRPAGSLIYYEGHIPFMCVADITKDEKMFVSSASKSIKEAGLKKTRMVEANTLLLSNSGATLGVPKINTFLTTFNDGIAAFLYLNDDVKTYLYWYFKSKTDSLRKINQGTAQPNLNTDLIRCMLVPLPPLSEQKRIVAKIEELMPLVEEYGVAQEKLNHLNEALPEALKKSILQQAIQGKLVPQDPKDEPASALLAQIRKEKEQLVKAGKLKKKDLATTPITDEEKPFEIPESWEWCRLGDCVSNRAGLAYNKGDLDKKTSDMIRVLRGGNIFYGGWKKEDNDVMIAREFVNDELLLKKGTFITPAVTSLENMGKTALIDEDLYDTVVGGFVLMLQSFFYENSLLKYLLYFFCSAYYKEYCKSITNKSGQAFYNISRAKLMNLPVPLPPLAEQKRIVAKIEELMAMVDGMK